MLPAVEPALKVFMALQPLSPQSLAGLYESPRADRIAISMLYSAYEAAAEKAAAEKEAAEKEAAEKAAADSNTNAIRSIFVLGP